jgi:hypothetical protein
MTPRDHPAEEREAGILAPAIRSAATVSRSYAFQEVPENREEDEPVERAEVQLLHVFRVGAASK